MSEHDADALLSVAQAIRLLDDIAVAPRQVTVPLDESEGLRLAEDLAADRDYPPFRKSLMDGYAVRSADIASGKATLRVVGTIAAGQMPERGIEAGETMAIMTGAPLPEGADGVVPVEDVAERVVEGEMVQVVRAASPERYVAARGSDCPAGRVVLSRGVLIGPAQVAVLASIGSATVRCFARPRVAVIGTGDELTPVEQTPTGAQIRDSNTHMLAALLRRLGCEVVQVQRVGDDPADIRRAIESAMGCDALFIAGGMSMGEFDYVPRLLEEAGVSLRITKLRIKPGKPFLFGVCERGEATSVSEKPELSDHSAGGATFVFGLPGNPVSAFVCTLRLASRVLCRLAGGTPLERWGMGRLDTGLPANGPREFYQPALRHAPHGRTSAQAEFVAVTPLNWKGSADLFTLAQANALIVRAENEPAIPKGAVISVLEI